MSANEEVRRSLLDMGVDADKSHEAALRYHSVDAAINWVFGEGESWTPSSAATADSLPGYYDNGMWGNSTPPAAQPPPPPPPLRSNNPFRTGNVAKPAAPPRPPRVRHAAAADDDDAQLQMALKLLQQDGGQEGGGDGTTATAPGGGTAGDAEAGQERTVRASAPPPSPRADADAVALGVSDDVQVLPERAAFGPSRKHEDGTSALVPIVPPGASSNREEEDFQRALQESMMTASFHSIQSDDVPIPLASERQPGAPVVYLTVKEPAFAAHLMQAVAAVPQMRDVFAGLAYDDRDMAEFQRLQEAMAEQDSGRENFIVVDSLVQGLHSSWNSYEKGVIVTDLPPHAAVQKLWLPSLEDVMSDVARHRSQLIDFDNALGDFFRKPEQLFVTRLSSQADLPHHFVTFERTTSTPVGVHPSLANILWTPENPSESITQLADVIFVSLKRTPGIAAPKWELESEVVLDRYLAHNVAWAMQIRANQSAVQAEMHRLKEQAEQLSTFRGNSVPDAIKTLIAQLDTKVEGRDEERAALKAKLEDIGAVMAAKTARLQDAVAERDQAASGALFATDDPALNQNRYLLRAVLWHDGFMTPGKHLYAYVRDGDSDAWFRVQDDAERVSWETVAADTTGQFTDGGPYLLVYSRDGPRPAVPTPEAASPVAAEEGVAAGGEEVMDVDSRGEESLINLDGDDDEKAAGAEAPPPAAPVSPPVTTSPRAYTTPLPRPPPAEELPPVYPAPTASPSATTTALPPNATSVTTSPVSPAAAPLPRTSTDGGSPRPGGHKYVVGGPRPSPSQTRLNQGGLGAGGGVGPARVEVREVSGRSDVSDGGSSVVLSPVAAVVTGLPLPVPDVPPVVEEGKKEEGDDVDM